MALTRPEIVCSPVWSLGFRTAAGLFSWHHICGGIAEFLGISPTLVRLLMIIAGLCSFGTTVIVYFIASLLIPKQSYVQSYHSI
ncbi:PspC domain-containing protein [Paenibacillus radicis (ex Xue et al. 2023)]|uniref:PspC domain-containing protein n=1 Tax=Paenibacillus radicis (ex Xue et al. 2023) TaxID=2972489 RepID=A0ABT1YKK9_9BACL|nr:PspC domain-containing protein [Paenibacillus radicis (ex Xue et al. 2023)]MCR8633714.1 PspC domain-containing protein [Paenibacillus radicis (ex Xue et al. 2023)]